MDTASNVSAMSDPLLLQGQLTGSCCKQWEISKPEQMGNDENTDRLLQLLIGKEGETELGTAAKDTGWATFEQSTDALLAV